jgi:hypothetical protein
MSSAFSARQKRLHNADIISLWHLIQVGTPIEIV